MLYILFACSLLIPAFAGIGKLVGFLTSELWTGISGKIILGLIFTTLAFTLTAFFTGLNIYTELPTLIIGLFSFFYFKIFSEFSSLLRQNFKIFIVFFLTILLFGSFYPFILDHFGYYVPSIFWLKEVGLVKGISNLDLILGQMSFWHILQAGFSSFSDIFLRLNSVLLVIYLIYILEKKQWIHLVFFPILLLFSQSPSPDLPVIIFSLMLTSEILKGNTNSSILNIFATFIFAIKPTMIWIPVFTMLYTVFILKAKFKTQYPALIILLLFIFKNLWSFGFPVFPVAFVDLNLSWKPNVEILRISSETAILKTYDMQYSIAEINNFSPFDYIKNWLFLDGIKSYIHILFVILMIVFTIFTLRKKSKIYYFLWIAVFIKTLLTLYFSAQYRFFIDVFFVIIFIFLNEKLNKKSILIISTFLIFASFLILSFPQFLQKNIPSFKLGNYMLGISKDQFIEPAHFQLKKYNSHQIGNLKFNVVKDYPFNFDTPLPAISPGFLIEDLDAGIFPQMRSADLSDGFIWKKLNKNETKKLKLIIDNLNKER